MIAVTHAPALDLAVYIMAGRHVHCDISAGRERLTMTERQRAPGRRGRVQAAAPTLSPVNTTLTEPVERQVYRSIRQGLMQGLIPPGGTLTSRSLAQELGTSTQPVRDALKRLEADGFLEGRPQSGFYVREMSRAEFTELTEIRVRLEGLAGRKAAESAVPSGDIAVLRRMNARFRDLRDPKDQMALNQRFHFNIYLRADRPQLLAMIQNLWVRIGPVLHHHPELHHPFVVRSDAVTEVHNAMIAALETRDGDAAEEAIRADITNASHLILPHLAAAPSDDTDPGLTGTLDG